MNDFKEKCGIYGICNTVNGKWYIGQSIDIEKRKYNHFFKLRRGDHFNPHFQRAFIQCGEDNFEFHILEETSEDMLDVRERAWINYYQSFNMQYGYNLNKGGHQNHHHSKKTCQKISDKQMGRISTMKGKKRPPFSEEWKKNMSISHKGKSFSDETRKNMSIARTGEKHSEEWNRNISESHKGKKLSEEHKKNLSEAKKGKPWSNTRRISQNNRKTT